jgi:quercetin dioxygenase-like cupin family protein
MPVITAENAPVFDADGNTITGLASPSRGARDVAAWRVRLEPGKPSPRHTLTREETFIVLSGSITAQFADSAETATEGGALIVPAGVEFFLSAGYEPVEAICVLPVGGQAIVDGLTITPPWAK